jgi:HK97 family phage prohead protease
MPQPKHRVTKYEGKESTIDETTFATVEIKGVTEDEKYYKIEAYLSKFNEVDAYNDTIKPGAYAKTIAEMRMSGKPLKMLWQHRSDKPIGVWDELVEDAYGLLAKGRMPKASDFVKKEVMPQLELKSIDSTSIGYRPREWEYNNDTDIRTLKDIDLKEGSLVTFPADKFALVTDLKSIVPDSIDIKSESGAFNARIEIMKKGAEQEVKDHLSQIYSKFELECPFEENAKVSVVEIKHLTKSNLVWALKNLELSTNAANFIAESVKGTTASEDGDSQGDEESSEEQETIDESKEDFSSLNESLEKFNQCFN